MALLIHRKGAVVAIVKRQLGILKSLLFCHTSPNM